MTFPSQAGPAAAQAMKILPLSIIFLKSSRERDCDIDARKRRIGNQRADLVQC